MISAGIQAGVLEKKNEGYGLPRFPYVQFSRITSEVAASLDDQGLKHLVELVVLDQDRNYRLSPQQLL